MLLVTALSAYKLVLTACQGQGTLVGSASRSHGRGSSRARECGARDEALRCRVRRARASFRAEVYGAALNPRGHWPAHAAAISADPPAVPGEGASATARLSDDEE